MFLSFSFSFSLFGIHVSQFANYLQTICKLLSIHIQPIGTNTFFRRQAGLAVYRGLTVTLSTSFSTGVSELTWDVKIQDDNLMENNEKLKLVLKNPINALLGRNNKTVITIVNKNTGW